MSVSMVWPAVRHAGVRLRLGEQGYGGPVAGMRVRGTVAYPEWFVLLWRVECGGEWMAAFWSGSASADFIDGGRWTIVLGAPSRAQIVAFPRRARRRRCRPGGTALLR